MATIERTAAAAGQFTLGDELTVRRLGFGAMRITGEGIWGPPRDHGEAIRVLRRAIELGVDLIDTADSYGPFVSEELIAEALHPYPEGLVIATKGGLVRPGPHRWEREGRPDHLRAACEGSLRRLRVDRIDLYQLHSPDPRVPFADSVGTLRDLSREGKIRLIGLSNVSVAELHEARGIVDVVSVQNRYNLVDRGAADVLDECTRLGIGFIPWYPLATGDFGRAIATLDRIGARHGATRNQVALAWLLSKSKVMLPIPGTSRVAHLEDNVGAASLALTEAEHGELESLVPGRRDSED
jgi:pyridoxine 4-dehydrogenase